MQKRERERKIAVLVAVHFLSLSLSLSRHHLPPHRPAQERSVWSVFDLRHSLYQIVLKCQQ